MSTPIQSRDSVEKRSVDQYNVTPAISVLATSVAPNWPRNWRAYAALVSGFFMMFNCWCVSVFPSLGHSADGSRGMVNAYGTFLGFYDQNLLSEYSDLHLSLVGGTESFLLLFPSIFAGRLLDARRHYYLGFTGFLFLFLGYLLLSFTGGQGLKDQGNYGLVWLTSGMLAGLGMTCFFTYSSHNVIQVR